MCMYFLQVLFLNYQIDFNTDWHEIKYLIFNLKNVKKLFNITIDSRYDIFIMYWNRNHIDGQKSCVHAYFFFIRNFSEVNKANILNKISNNIIYLLHRFCFGYEYLKNIFITLSETYRYLFVDVDRITHEMQFTWMFLDDQLSKCFSKYSGRVGKFLAILLQDRFESISPLRNYKTLARPWMIEKEHRYYIEERK